ncbi:hypothetical protein D9619_010661 [Psilocybe cf. subviscida]|uniref:SWR1-complex protein 5 n=1 Tax=Psilocybe cf. subviscida TaxID=2480587 RepID=A0A8H5B8A3_9AGAR|nr:hypothetical protein D9619_010661 [Psilocybe cf. subviscida]
MPDPQNDIYATDSEDEDYIPRADEDSGDSDNPNDEEIEPVAEVVDEEERKRKREELWSSFQASVSEPGKGVIQPPPAEKTVKIERKYLFAGKEVIEVVEVPEDSSDAKKWPLWKEPNSGDPSEQPVAQEPLPVSPKPESPASTEAAVSVAPAPVAGASNPVPKPPAKRPGPRKPKTTLAALPGPGKAKKLTTLDKSAMDWKAHLQAQTEVGSSVKDELEANRRGGGYLEKVEFLKRVEDRKEDSLESLKGAKRRRL